MKARHLLNPASPIYLFNKLPLLIGMKNFISNITVEEFQDGDVTCFGC